MSKSNCVARTSKRPRSLRIDCRCEPPTSSATTLPAGMPASVTTRGCSIATPIRGVDLVYYDKANRVEYDFIVAPGVDPSTIELTFTGVAEIKSGDEGDLVLETTAGDLIVSTPFVYQDFDGERHQVAAAFERRGARGAGFALGPYDRSQPLIIDPRPRDGNLRRWQRL